MASGVTSRPVKPVPPVVTIDVDVRVGDPFLHHGADVLDLVAHDVARGERVAGLFDAGGERVAGLVVCEGAGVRHRQHGDADGDEGAAFVETGHG